jgi:predicted RNase H-like HicB family nuclease
MKKHTYCSVEAILTRPYSRVLIPDSESGGFTARILEFPGCIAEGDSAEEALQNLEKAASGWIEAALDLGQEIPTPHVENEYSGKYPLRMPKSLHRQITELAEQEGTSINQFIVAALAEKAGSITASQRFSRQFEPVNSLFTPYFQIALPTFPLENQGKVGTTLVNLAEKGDHSIDKRGVN